VLHQLLYGNKDRDLSGISILVTVDSGGFTDRIMDDTIPGILRCIKATTGITPDLQDCTVADADDDVRD